MPRTVNVFRYVVFGLSVICNSIIASVAVWNMSIIHSLGLKLASTGIDIYLIVVGASGLALIFPVLFFELSGSNAFIGRIWFECLWLGVFSILELVGGIVLTAVSHPELCNLADAFDPSFCVSTQILQAFSWISALLFITYFTMLFVATLTKLKVDPTIWHCSVRRFSWLGPLRTLSSAPPSPMSPKFRNQQTSIIAPRPIRAAVPPPEPIYSYRSGLSLEYEIEHFQHPVPGFASQPASAPTVSPYAAGNGTFQTISPPSLYPQFMQSTLPTQPVPAQVVVPTNLPPSPPPLGDWPRKDPPVRGKRKQPPPSLLLHPEARTGVDPGSISSSPPRPRPTGPRVLSLANEESRQYTPNEHNRDNMS